MLGIVFYSLSRQHSEIGNDDPEVTGMLFRQAETSHQPVVPTWEERPTVGYLLG